MGKTAILEEKVRPGAGSLSPEEFRSALAIAGFAPLSLEQRTQKKGWTTQYYWLRLHREGKRVIGFHLCRFGKAPPGYDLDAVTWRCDCPDGIYRNVKRCKHARAIQQLIKRGLIPMGVE